MNEKHLLEEYEALLLNIALTNYAEKEGKLLVGENNELKKLKYYEASKESKIVLDKKIRKNLIKEKTKGIYNKFTKYKNKAASIIIIMAIILFSTNLSVEAFRINIINFLVRIQGGYTSIRSGDDSEEYARDNSLFINWKDSYVPTYTPYGFKVANITNNTDVKTIEYINEQGDKIWFNQMNLSSTLNLDSEDAKKIEEIYINGNKGLLIEKDNLNTLTWTNEQYLFLILSSIEDKELIKIAKSVNYLK